MKRILTFLFFLVVVFAYAESTKAQGPRPTGVSSTSAPVQSRYEIIVTTSGVRAVLKLDKYTGEVFELARNKTIVKNKDEEHAWQRTKRRPYADKDEAPDEVNYQIYASGENGIYTYLLNLGTGETWILAKEAGKEELYWYPLKHQ